MPETPLAPRVLLVARPDDAAVVRAALERAEAGVTLEPVTSRAELEQALEHRHDAAIVVEGVDGLDYDAAQTVWRGRSQALAGIVFEREFSEASLARVMRLGAADYVTERDAAR